MRFDLHYDDGDRPTRRGIGFVVAVVVSAVILATAFVLFAFAAIEALIAR